MFVPPRPPAVCIPLFGRLYFQGSRRQNGHRRRVTWVIADRQTDGGEGRRRDPPPPTDEWARVPASVEVFRLARAYKPRGQWWSAQKSVSSAEYTTQSKDICSSWIFSWVSSNGIYVSFSYNICFILNVSLQSTVWSPFRWVRRIVCDQRCICRKWQYWKISLFFFLAFFFSLNFFGQTFTFLELVSIVACLAETQKTAKKYREAV